MPWTIIGWLLLAALGLLGLLAVMFIVEAKLAPWFFARLYHYQTRNTPPRPGQIWMQGDQCLDIRANTIGNGRIVMSSRKGLSVASWSDSPDEWRYRVRTRKLWLLKETP